MTAVQSLGATEQKSDGRHEVFRCLLCSSMMVMAEILPKVVMLMDHRQLLQLSTAMNSVCGCYNYYSYSPKMYFMNPIGDSRPIDCFAVLTKYYTAQLHRGAWPWGQGPPCSVTAGTYKGVYSWAESGGSQQG